MSTAKRLVNTVSLGKNWWEVSRKPGETIEVKPRRKISNKYYSVKQIAQMFSVSINAVYDLIYRGELESVAIGGVHRIPHEVVEDYLNRPMARRRVR